jgi:hypothetical protein
LLNVNGIGDSKLEQIKKNIYWVVWRLKWKNKLS